jgi:hypothetical protein
MVWVSTRPPELANLQSGQALAVATAARERDARRLLVKFMASGLEMPSP